jgi:hypothetical protein
MKGRRHVVPAPSGAATDLGITAGAAVGGVVGSIAGPVGAVAGAAIGAGVATIVDDAWQREKAAKTAHERELDDAIGVTAGTIGAGPIVGFVSPAAEIAFLRADHDALETLGQRALAELAAGDYDDVRAILAEIEARVLAHVEGEERELLPAWEKVDPKDAAALRSDHAAFRRILLELGIAGDIHAVRLERVRALLGILRSHARRENRGMYAWATARTR